MAAEVSLRVANVFHAGDGNLHPLILFDGRVPGAVQRGLSVTTFYLGSTSLLIVVGVALDTITQIEARLAMRDYRGFIKR